MRGVGAGLALPFADNDAMNLKLAEITTEVAPGAHAASYNDLLDHCCDATDD